LAEALESPVYMPVRKKLATACWQNGLDYKEYLMVFVKLIIQEEWQTGFEAFTVIENMKHYPEKDIRTQAVEYIKASLKDATGKKLYLLQELLA